MAISFGGLGLPPLYTELKVKIDGFKTEMDKAGHEAIAKANEISKNMQGAAAVSKGLTQVGKTATKYVTLPLAAAGLASGKFAMDYESAFAGVRKTVDATEEEYAKLSDGIRQMAKEVPTGAAAIAEVTEAAGQLGIKNENLLDFTRVMIDLGEATNLGATEGATQLARFANITQMSQGDFGRLGSTIVDLGNNFATTEAEIVAMGLRLAGSGKQIGLSEAQIMGFATALSSVGIEAEAGGSAFSRVMVDMQLAVETNSERLNDFAAVAGMSGTEFKRAFEEDAGAAMISFIAGLGTAEERGLSAIKVLDDMGISEVRLRDALLRASGASDVFTEAINVGSRAWEENNALTKEAEQRYGTSESKMQIAKNRIIDVGISIGEKLLPHAVKLVEKVADIVDWFDNLDEGTQSLIIKLGIGAAAFGPVTSAVGGLLGIVSKAPQAFSLFTGGLKLAMGGTSLLGGGATALTGALSGVTTAAGATGAAGAIGSVGSGLIAAAGVAAPFVAAGAAVAGAGYLIYKGFQNEAIPAVDLFTDTVYQSTGTVVGYGERSGEVMKQVTRTVSEETQTQVTAFMDMKQNVDQLTMEMFTGITEITRGGVIEITEELNGMANTAISAIHTQRDETIASFNEMFGQSTALTAEEKAKVIEDVNEMAKQREMRISDMKDELVRLYDEIRKKGIDSAQEEMQRVTELMDELATESIKAMARNQDEQEVILGNLKKNSGTITSQMVSETIKKLNEQRDKGVASAEEMYQKQINAALDYKEMMRDANGQLSAEHEATAQKMIDIAEEQKRKTVEQYEQLRVNGLVKLRDEYGKLATNLDMKTGEMRGSLNRLFKGADEWNALVFENKEFTITKTERTRRIDEYIQVTSRSGGVISNYFSGLDFVPWDGYIARLHKGERVLTADENKQYKETGGLGGGINVNIDKFENHTKEDVQKLVRRIGQELQRQRIARG